MLKHEERKDIYKWEIEQTELLLPWGTPWPTHWDAWRYVVKVKKGESAKEVSDRGQ